MGRTRECLELAQTANGDDFDLEDLFLRAEAYLFGGLATTSVPLFRRIAELDPGNAAAQWFLVPAAALSRQFDAAVEAGERYLDRFGPDGEVHLWTAVGYQGLGDLDKAREHYDRTLEILGSGEDSITFF